ncbi:S8 family peptidase [Arcobacter sp. YIC-310]|uniref:S8 family peptidase n=1 Tax=Arcobacter sp. YIC-310 TaxID=3376632 RepID=UPI003C262DAC
MKLKHIKNYSIAITLAISLTACGGGGSGSSNSSSSISNVVNSVLGNDFFQFAWHINKDINATYKTNNNINNEAHISLEEAWAVTKGKQTNGEAIKVAIIDEDFEINHPNIKDKVFYTYNESDGGTNVSDTDGDTFYHGLAAAGIIAGDEIGVAPNVEIALININLATQGSTIDKYLTAFNKAKEAGAKVINCSWSISSEDPNLWDSYTLPLRALIEDFKDQGIIIVFASGNDGTDLDQAGEKSLSELDSVIGVGATSVLNDVTSYSNYGSAIDVIAPGGGSLNDGLLGILSLDQSGNAGRNSNSQLSYTNENLNNYTLTSGTSFAAPTTSGLVALILSVNPNLTFDQVRNILISTTDKIGGSNADYTTGNFDTKRAYGKINAKKAIEAAQATLP